MEVLLEGSRFTAETLSLANQAPADQLPLLTEAEKQEAKRFGWSEEQYARSLYAQQLHEPELLEVVDRLAHLLEGFIARYLPGGVIASITFAASRGLYRVATEYRGQTLHLSIREGVVADLFESGDERALDRLRRIVEMAALPYLRRQQAS